MSHFGPYRLLKRLARGGMGEIYLAQLERESGFAKAMVIKRILPQYSDDPAFVDMFNREARIAAQLSHQNVVQIFDNGQHADAYFIAMEYVHGRDLRTVLEAAKAKGALIPLPVAMAIITAAARGLSYAHRCRDLEGRSLDIVHRDVSPQNILMSYEGEIKLTDFGLAHAVDDAQADGQVQGKFAYMSPEQTFGYELDSRSDIFSLGIVAYELLTGERPFEGDSTRTLVQAIRAGTFTPVTEVRAELPDTIDAVFTKALARDVKDRYPDVRALLDDLEPILQQTEGWPATGAVVGGLVAALCPEGAKLDLKVTSGTLVSGQPVNSGIGQTMPAALPISGAFGTIPAAKPIAVTEPDAGAGTTLPESKPPSSDPGVIEPPSPSQTPKRSTVPLFAVGALVLVGGVTVAAMAFIGQESDDWTLDINAVPEHAEVSVDGQPRGVTPLVERVAGGQTVQILIKHKGYKTHVQNVTLDDGGGTMPVSVELEPKKVEGQILLDVVPKTASIEVDGTPLTEASEVEGRYTITRVPSIIAVKVSAENYYTRTEKMDVPADSTLRRVVQLTPYPIRIDVVPKGKSRADGQVLIQGAGGFQSRCGLPCSTQIALPGPVTVEARLDGVSDAWVKTRTGQPGSRLKFEVPIPEPKREPEIRLRGTVVGQGADGSSLRSGFREINLAREPSGSRFANLKGVVRVTFRYAFDASSKRVKFTLGSEPWSQVTWSGGGGQTPLVGKWLSPGLHTFRLVGPAPHNHKATLTLRFKHQLN